MKPGVRSGCELAYERGTRTHMRTVGHETVLNHHAYSSEPKQCKFVSPTTRCGANPRSQWKLVVRLLRR